MIRHANYHYSTLQKGSHNFYFICITQPKHMLLVPIQRIALMIKIYFSFFCFLLYQQ